MMNIVILLTTSRKSCLSDIFKFIQEIKCRRINKLGGLFAGTSTRKQAEFYCCTDSTILILKSYAKLPIAFIL